MTSRNWWCNGLLERFVCVRLGVVGGGCVDKQTHKQAFRFQTYLSIDLLLKKKMQLVRVWLVNERNTRPNFNKTNICTTAYNGILRPSACHVVFLTCCLVSVLLSTCPAVCLYCCLPLLLPGASLADYLSCCLPVLLTAFLAVCLSCCLPDRHAS